MLGGRQCWAGLFVLLVYRGLCANDGGQRQVGDGLAIVQTGVAVKLERLDRQLPVQAHNASSGVEHEVLVGLNLGVVGVPRLHETEHQHYVIDSSAHGTQVSPVVEGNALKRTCQFLPVAVVVVLGVSKLHSFWGLSRVQVDTRRLVELLASLTLFLVSGPAVIILNKHIMREHHFHFPIILASLGNGLLMLVTRLSVGLGVCTLQGPPMGWARYARVVLMMNLFNFGTQVLGMWSYLFVSVPEIQILKSLTVVLVMVFATVIIHEPYNVTLILSVILLAAGTCVSAIFEVNGQSQHLVDRPGAEGIGILLCVLASTFEASKSICSQILMDSVNVFDGVYLSSPVFVFLGLIFVAALELRGLLHCQFTLLLGCLLVLNAVLTGLIVLSSFWFVKLVGALTLKVVTQARTLALILVSVFFFHEDCSSMQYLGYVLTLIGMGFYDQAKGQLAGQLAEAKKKLEAAQKEAQGEVEVQGKT